MLFRDMIELVAITHTANAIGDPVETTTKTQVFADKMAINQSEFYQANAQGLRPEIKFKIRLIDYSQQSQFEWNSKPYKIIRVYDKDDEFIEITGQGIVNGVM